MKTSNFLDDNELYIKEAAFSAVIMPGKECSPTGVASVETNPGQNN